MPPVHIKITKVYNKFSFDDGSEFEGQGIEVAFGPKMNKTIYLENKTTGKNSNLEFLQLVNPDLYHWYINSPTGAVLDLFERKKDTNSFAPIYTETKLDNEL